MTIASKIEKSCNSPMLFRHSMSIAQKLMPIYNTIMHKNKINVALNLMRLTVGCYETSNRPQGRLVLIKIIITMRKRLVLTLYFPSSNHSAWNGVRHVHVDNSFSISSWINSTSDLDLRLLLFVRLFWKK